VWREASVADVDVADLNPAFAAKLAALRDALDRAGVSSSVISGYRSPEYQQQLINQGVRPAAQPWRSFHQYGLAADLNLPGGDYRRMWDLAPQFGLHPLGAFDAGHVQLAGDLPGLVSQLHLAGWRPASQPAPATGAIAYAPPGQPSRVATVAPGTTLNSSPLDIVINAESGNRNVNNTTQGTSSGQAQGFAQITTGTWSDFAPKAGVDLKMYPTPDSAPRDVQIAVANTIPLNRWAPSTVNAVLAKYPGIDTSQTLGAIQSAALGGASGGSGTAAGGNLASGAAGAPAAPQGSLAGFKPGSPAEASMKAAAKTLGTDAQPQAPDMPSPPPIPPAQAQGGLMMMGPGGQNQLPRALAQQYLQQQGVPTAPSLAAFGPQAPPRPFAPPGGASGMPAMPGTTLNSPSQLQMALMTGAINPYDLYASGGYGGGYQGSV